VTNLSKIGPCYVYGVLDPITGTIFYVGTSINPERRMPQHRSGTDSSTHRRCKQILSAGAEPQLVILHKCNTRNHALYIEHQLLVEYPALINRARDLYQLSGRYRTVQGMAP
jgi:predicted GIY-YIG superfamily endonuclease